MLGVPGQDGMELLPGLLPQAVFQEDLRLGEMLADEVLVDLFLDRLPAHLLNHALPGVGRVLVLLVAGLWSLRRLRFRVAEDFHPSGLVLALVLIQVRFQDHHLLELVQGGNGGGGGLGRAGGLRHPGGHPAG